MEMPRRHLVRPALQFLFLNLLLQPGLSAAASEDGLGASRPSAGFRTKHARFEPAPFDALPGWREDHISDAWDAFRQSCVALGKKPAWRATCARAAGLAGGNDAVLRQFFEGEFDLFQIFNSESTRPGVITGYYEPQLSGSRSFSAITPYPVYGTPDDMLFLDARLVPAERNTGLKVRVEGRNVLPADPLRPADQAFQLDLSGIEPDIRTRKYRVRIDGKRMVPYLSRQEIERAPLPRAKVIAWVENRAALYSMQIQGSGKIRLSDGEIIRVGYAEQNGHVFQPSVLASAQYVSAGSAGGSARPMRTRSLRMADDDDDEPQAFSKAEIMAAFAVAMPDATDATDPVDAPRTRSMRPSTPRPAASDVDRMITMLMPAGKPPIASGMASSTVASTAVTPTGAAALTAAALETPPTAIAAPASSAPLIAVTEVMLPAPAAPLASVVDQAQLAAPSAVVVAARPDALLKSAVGTIPVKAQPLRPIAIVQKNIPNNDPSYVFFREISNTGDGPIGALGVPLTAGRSLAVDPRTTPLGFPVFISTRGPRQKQVLNRLMLAQDTGGAIRGAVRADYFWGFGERAFLLASQMKEDAQMWLLLPKGQKTPSSGAGPLTRGIGAPELAECVVADPELCTE